MVEPGDFRAAAEVIALLEPLGMPRAVEEVDKESQRVFNADDVAEAAHVPGGQPLVSAAERPVVSLRSVQVGGRADAEPERPGGGLGPCLQDEVVVRELVESPQVQGGGVLIGHDKPEEIDPEAPGLGEVGDVQGRVGGPDDVRHGRQVTSHVSRQSFR